MSEANLLQAALKLPTRRREELAEAILGSVKRPSQRHLDSLWVQEAESRVDGLLKGRIKTVPGAQVLAYRGRR
jgi:Putative addiction module component